MMLPSFRHSETMPSVSGYTVRPASPSDDAAIARLLVAVDASWSPVPFYFSVREGGFPAALHVIRQPHVAGLVALLDANIVGYAALCEVNRRMVLSNVMVHPDVEGAGVGKTLVTMLCRIAFVSATEVYADVLDDSTRACALYTSLGFFPVSRTRAEMSGRRGTLMRLSATSI